jgi:transcriptional regulator with XRE-family HTH domain
MIVGAEQVAVAIHGHLRSAVSREGLDGDPTTRRREPRVFARYLNVRPKLVSEWERGEKRPSGPSLKLLAIVKANSLEAIA